jgi:hypothetical protein
VPPIPADLCQRSACAYRNAVIDAHVDLETLGRELGVLGSWEQLTPEPS